MACRQPPQHMCDEVAQDNSIHLQPSVAERLLSNHLAVVVLTVVVKSMLTRAEYRLWRISGKLDMVLLAV